MAVMSFAHLKTKNRPEQEKEPAPVPSGPSTVVRNQPASQGNHSGIMSFAHLKTRPSQPSPPQPNPTAIHEEESPAQGPRVFRIPSVMPSALLIAVNYCQGCGRFLPAGEEEKSYGNLYGRCLRNVRAGIEEWKVIKRHIQVSSCFYFKNQGSQNAKS